MNLYRINIENLNKEMFIWVTSNQNLTNTNIDLEEKISFYEERINQLNHEKINLATKNKELIYENDILN